MRKEPRLEGSSFDMRLEFELAPILGFEDSCFVLLLPMLRQGSFFSFFRLLLLFSLSQEEVEEASVERV